MFAFIFRCVSRVVYHVMRKSNGLNRGNTCNTTSGTIEELQTSRRYGSALVDNFIDGYL
ncbi:hypothetical protein HanRHA438_Chr02g0061331 [Helianthus annuus]|nr:hypothetical protein HanRHA438_Chr02g0061331 [Helianthus annuus]KAJ0951328.1 hypothetical protein HanPSC8_Chr02g0058691 [Helianthus annuus]